MSSDFTKLILIPDDIYQRFIKNQGEGSGVCKTVYNINQLNQTDLQSGGKLNIRADSKIAKESVSDTMPVSLTSLSNGVKEINLPSSRQLQQSSVPSSPVPDNGQEEGGEETEKEITPKKRKKKKEKRLKKKGWSTRTGYKSDLSFSGNNTDYSILDNFSDRDNYSTLQNTVADLTKVIKEDREERRNQPEEMHSDSDSNSDLNSPIQNASNGANSDNSEKDDSFGLLNVNNLSNLPRERTKEFIASTPDGNGNDFVKTAVETPIVKLPKNKKLTSGKGQKSKLPAVKKVESTLTAQKTQPNIRSPGKRKRKPTIKYSPSTVWKQTGQH